MKKATLLLGGRVAFGKLADDIPELSAIIEILYGGEEDVDVVQIGAGWDVAAGGDDEVVVAGALAQQT